MPIKYYVYMIKRVKWLNNPILGNLELDFTKPDGSIYNTILFIGENGCGKTTALETLSEFLSGGSIEPIDYIDYTVDGINIRATQKPLKPDSSLDLNGVRNGFHYQIDLDNNKQLFIIRTAHQYREGKVDDKYDIRTKGCVYSKARSGYKTVPITTIKTSQMDDNKYDKDANDDFSYLKQLLVDLETQDNSDAVLMLREKKLSSIEECDKISRISRFSSSFNGFFDNIKFLKVDNNNKKEKQILFKKYGAQINLDDLSTGEKQIVFRGTFLLRNSKTLSNGFVFIDELELSMHPKWQEKALNYYRGLYTSNGAQTTQMFFASHSEHIVKSAVKDKDDILIIILKSGPTGVTATKMDTTLVLPTITSAEINYKAFDVNAVDYHIALFARLQDIKSCPTVKAMDDYIKLQPQFNPSMHYKVSSYVDVNGHTHTYDTLPTFVRNAIDHPDSNRTFSYDEIKTSISLMETLL